MKKLILLFICILISATIVLALPVNGEEKIYDDIIRYHVIANSDFEDDQKLKLEVRNATLPYIQNLISNCKDKEEAKEIICENLDMIESISSDVINSMGYSYSVSVSFDNEWYSRREFSNLSFPLGNYLSLQIKIGESKGKNFWCVMFPFYANYVATDSADEAIPASLTKEQYNLISESNKSYEVRFKVLEIIEEIQKNKKNNKNY